MQGVRPGAWIFWTVILLATVRGSWQFHQRHAGQRDEIAKAIGSIGFIYGAPQPDQSGSRVFYLSTTDDGVGIFDCDATTGKRRALFDDPGIRNRDLRNCFSLISPDDNLFAYSFDSRLPEGYLSICQTDTGEETARTSTPQWNVTAAAWLTPEMLVFLGEVDQEQAGKLYQLHLLQKQPNGEWQPWTNFFRGLRLVNASCLAAVSTNTFAWVDDQGLCSMNTLSNKVNRLFQPEGKKISQMSYSRQSGEFLITCRERNACTLWRLKLNPKAANGFQHLTSDSDIHDAQWLDGGYAYLNQGTLVINGGDAGKPARFAQASVDRFTVAGNGRELFFVGTASNEPWAGIWRCHLADDTLANIVPYSEFPAPQATRVEPSSTIIHFGEHRSLKYYIYHPAHFDRRKKYPLIIGDTPFVAQAYESNAHGPSWAEALADGGAYVVIVHRRSWFGDLEEWGKNVTLVWQHLASDPSIDPGRVYLLGVSAETEPMSRLIEERPGLWKGAMFLNPSQLPDFAAVKSDQRLPAMLISAGAYEEESARFKQFQQDACAHGTRVDVLEHPHSRHYLFSIDAVRERTRAMVDFVCNQ
jgi:dipeptidyl aminopeptidase/acylaminoacyl peptidase